MHVQGTSYRENLEDTLALLYNAEKAFPLVEGYISSARIAVARSWMDMQIDRAAAMEERALEICQGPEPNLASKLCISSQDSIPSSCVR